MADVVLIVNGRRYGGWKSLRVTRSIETVAGQFQLEANDRWAEQPDRLPIAEEDAFRLEIDGELVLDGFIDTRQPVLSPTRRSLSYSGRDRSAAIVDNSAVLERTSFRNTSVLDIAREAAAPFGITVSVQPGLSLPKVRKLVVNPGDTAYAVIRRAAESAGVLIVSDGEGGILLTRAGNGRAAALVEGQNIIGIALNYDARTRFRRYVVSSQIPGTDEAFGDATQTRAVALDVGVRRTSRIKLIRPVAGETAESARRRADWTARINAAKSDAATIAVRGWRQPDGKLWPTNSICAVRSPFAGIDGELLISQTDYALDDRGGEITNLRLVRPDAYTPEPSAQVKRSGGAWKELAGGAR